MRFITFLILMLLQTNSKIGMYGLIYIYWLIHFKCSTWKTDAWNEYTKINDLNMLQNVLFVKDCLSQNVPGSFNDKFHPSKLPLKYTTRSTSSHQLEANDFKAERYGSKSIVSKCTLDWDNLEKMLKQNFQMMK